MARILLIDDDDLVRTMLRITLAKHGHAVTEACNGREGLKLFESTAVDLVITDIVMPEKEGIEVVMELRRKDPFIKIIAMSGGGRMNALDYLAAARLLGASKVFTKPLSNEALLAAIDELSPDGRTSARPVLPQ